MCSLKLARADEQPSVVLCPYLSADRGAPLPPCAIALWGPPIIEIRSTMFKCRDLSECYVERIQYSK